MITGHEDVILEDEFGLDDGVEEKEKGEWWEWSTVSNKVIVSLDPISASVPLLQYRSNRNAK